MKLYNKPGKNEWSRLSERPLIQQASLNQQVNNILTAVKKEGDAAIKKFSKQFDNVDLDQLCVKIGDIQNIELSIELKEAMYQAYDNIAKFHTTQFSNEKQIDTTEGITCWRKNVAIEKVGLYIPGGSAPLFSTVLMLGIPAKLAGCKEIVLCTPCDKNGEVNNAIKFAAKLVGVDTIYTVGGAQAIAAMAYGTATISKVDKIFGPGNQYVTKAKELIQQDGVAIDMPAGPSEVLVIADKSAIPEFVASDLLAQAEHGPDSQVVLLSDSMDMITACIQEVNLQIKQLPRKAIAQRAIDNSMAIQLNNMRECFDFSNEYAPEHLIVASEQAENFMDWVVNAGSVFIGNYSCESVGDYASGTNHTLPTNGYARSYSGVSIDSFVKKITFQKLTAKGILNIGKTVEVMASAEGLLAHKNAVTVRLNTLKK